MWGLGIEHGPSSRVISPALVLYYYKGTFLSLNLVIEILKQWTERRKAFLPKCHGGRRKRCHPEEDFVSLSDHLTV